MMTSSCHFVTLDMGERGSRRGTGAPFYAPPPRRKTSAEIISEARAAIYGEISSAVSGGGGVGGGGVGGGSGGGGGALRSLRTRRPFTPRDPQRTLFTERARKADQRPPSAFDLKYSSLAESDEKTLEVTKAINQGEITRAKGTQGVDPQNSPSKKSLKNQAQSVQERSGDVWGGFPRLPHLSGRRKPLHRRNTTHTNSCNEEKELQELTEAILITQPFPSRVGVTSTDTTSKSLSPDSDAKKKALTVTKSVSYDGDHRALGSEVAVKHIAVQLPVTQAKYESMTVLEIAEGLSERSIETVRTIELLEALQEIVEKDAPAGNLREMLLRSLYTHVDCEDERVLVTIARVMFTMRVTGRHLATACKIVFKIARNDKNDHFFRNTNLLELLVEGCGRADPLTEGESCIYGAGALRFLALEPTLCAMAHRTGALHLAALHLKILNTAKAENPRAVSEQSTHALYQLTGSLRNLAGGAGSCSGEAEAKEFVSSGALAELLAALVHHTDRDVLTNVARCLSVLSAEECCCAWLCGSSLSAHALLRALAACATRAPLAVRLAYTLGNMAAADEQARINIYNEEGGVDVLLTILESYTKCNKRKDIKENDADHDLDLIGTDLGGSDGSNVDVIIKTVRVVANLCLTERAGKGLASTYFERSVKAILACLALAEEPAENAVTEPQSELNMSNDRERRGELATAALATLNNISFYREPPDPPDGADQLLDQLCTVTCRWLNRSWEASCEAVRTLGNLSRCTRAAQIIVIEGAMDALTHFLQHEDPSIRCAAAGVLVNVCGAGVDSVTVASLAVEALCSAADAGDASEAALLARALWNAQAHAPLSAHAAHQAAAALCMFIDDESVFADCEASEGKERRASESELANHHGNIEHNNDDDLKPSGDHMRRPFMKAYSVDQQLNLKDDFNADVDGTGCSGEDLGFEEGDLLGEEECECEPCRKLAVWEEFASVAIPLLEKLRPNRTDASVGTD